MYIYAYIYICIYINVVDIINIIYTSMFESKTERPIKPFLDQMSACQPPCLVDEKKLAFLFLTMF